MQVTLVTISTLPDETSAVRAPGQPEPRPVSGGGGSRGRGLQLPAPLPDRPRQPPGPALPASGRPR